MVKWPTGFSSKLLAEAQALAKVTGTVQWLALLVSEILDGPAPVLKKGPPLFIADCKSLCNHLVSPSSPTAIDDRRISTKVIRIWEHTCWLTVLLKKDAGEPVELLHLELMTEMSRLSASPRAAVGLLVRFLF